MNLLNLFKKVTAIIIVFIIFIKVFVLDIHALAFAPVAADVLIEVFGTLLVASGVNTQSEVDEMTWGEVSSNVKSGLSSGTINPSDVIVTATIDGVEQKMNFMEWLASGSQNVYLVSVLAEAALKDWIDSLTEDDIKPSYPGINTNGYSVMIKAKSKSYEGSVVCQYWNNYIEVYIDDNDGSIDYLCVWANIPRYTEQYWDGHLQEYNSGEFTSSYNHIYSTDQYYIEVYGDVRYPDGTAVEIDGAVPAIGETADGEVVTLDDVQTGEVPLDEVIIDYDKFDEDAIIDLVTKIIVILEQVPVIEEDTSTYDDSKENIQATVGELDIAEFNNLKMPLGIIDVFPFCLPFDFVRGMKLLVAEPEVPVFKTVIDFGEINGWDLGEYPVEISFEKWEPVAIVTRWTSLLLFSYVLIFISTKIVKGAGS